MEIIITSVITFLMVSGAFYYFVTAVKPDIDSQQRLANLNDRNNKWYSQIFSGEDEYLSFKDDWNIKPEDLFRNDPVFRVDLAVDPEDISNIFSENEGELTFQFSLKTRARIWDAPLSKINSTRPFEEERYMMLCKLTFKAFAESHVRMNYYLREEIIRKNKDYNPNWVFQLSSPDITVGLPLESIRRIFDQVVQCRNLKTPLELRLQLKSADQQMKRDKYQTWFELPVTGIDVGSKFK